MEDPAYPGTVNDGQREHVVRLLSEAFADDRLKMYQLDERLALVYRARSLAELELLLADPLDLTRSLVGDPVRMRVAQPDVVPNRGVVMGIMGGVARKGGWIVPRHLRVLAIMGGAQIDLRNAQLGPGVTEIEVFAFWGGAEILVPEWVRVEIVGTAFMGGIDVAGGGINNDPAAPILRVSGLVIMAGIDVARKGRDRNATRRLRQAYALAKRAREREG